VVNPSINANSVAELIPLAKKELGTLTFTSAGNGTTNHLSEELFKSLAKVDFLGGRITMMFDTASNFVDHVKSGKLRALGLTGTKRSAAISKDVVSLQNREIGLAMKEPALMRQIANAGIDIQLSSPPDFPKLITEDMVK